MLILLETVNTVPNMVAIQLAIMRVLRLSYSTILLILFIQRCVSTLQLQLGEVELIFNYSLLVLSNYLTNWKKQNIINTQIDIISRRLKKKKAANFTIFMACV